MTERNEQLSQAERITKEDFMKEVNGHLEHWGAVAGEARASLTQAEDQLIAIRGLLRHVSDIESMGLMPVFYRDNTTGDIMVEAKKRGALGFLRDVKRR